VIIATSEGVLGDYSREPVGRRSADRENRDTNDTISTPEKKQGAFDFRISANSTISDILAAWVVTGSLNLDTDNKAEDTNTRTSSTSRENTSSVGHGSRDNAGQSANKSKREQFDDKFKALLEEKSALKNTETNRGLTPMEQARILKINSKLDVLRAQEIDRLKKKQLKHTRKAQTNAQLIDLIGTGSSPATGADPRTAPDVPA
jgi:hypothetical protein